MFIYILDKVITKLEYRLSKKGKSNKLGLYRDILDSIDRYNNKTKRTLIIRHYRHLNFSVDKIE